MERARALRLFGMVMIKVEDSERETHAWKRKLRTHNVPPRRHTDVYSIPRIPRIPRILRIVQRTHEKSLVSDHSERKRERNDIAEKSGGERRSVFVVCHLSSFSFTYLLLLSILREWKGFPIAVIYHRRPLDVHRQLVFRCANMVPVDGRSPVTSLVLAEKIRDGSIDKGNAGSYTELIHACASALRGASLSQRPPDVATSRPVGPGAGLGVDLSNIDLALEVLVPALKKVMVENISEHEEESATLRATIRRLETERAQREADAFEQALGETVKQERELEKAREEITMLREKLLESDHVFTALEGELDRARTELSQATQLLEDRSAGYVRMCKENRELHAKIKDMRGNVLIFTRVRPRGLTGDRSDCVIKCHEEECALEFLNRHGEWKRYRFDRVFDESCTQESIYQEATSLIRSVMDGGDVLIFAYGQTGSGKTHTMQYLNRKALEDLFHYRQEDEEHGSSRSYRFSVQMLEIYNDCINDMLNPDLRNLRIQTASFRNEDCMTRVPEGTVVDVSNIEDVHSILERGSVNRSVGATKMNDRSSRSHMVFTVMVERFEEQGIVKRGRLHLIDLAGSERLDRSQAEGDRLTETKHINASLSSLGRVMGSIAKNQNHISFRDCKLTQLLEDSLRGGKNSKCMMFMHVTPEASSAQETRSTLEFGKGVVDNVVVTRK
jgi:hypothetical protein